MASDLSPPHGADAATALMRSARQPLVGRQNLLAILEEGLEGALGGCGRTFLVAGEPGIGKTRIVEELIRDATQRGFVAHVSRCHEVQGAPPLWPWARIAREVTGDRLDPDLLARFGIEGRALARLLPSAAGEAVGEPPSAAGEETLFELFEAIANLLRRASCEMPRLIVLEDVHWADAASLQLARFLGREVREHRVVLVVTYRDTEVGAHDRLAAPLADLAADAQLLQLEGLDEVAIARLLAHAAGFEVPDVLAAAVHAQTGGNPLFATEVVRMLAHEGRLGGPDEPTPESVPLPPSVRHILARRLQRLSRPTADVLARAAVLGAELDLAVLERSEGTRGREALLGALDEARAARLVEPVPDDPTRLRFMHDLVRETIYESIGMADRARLHADAAAALREAYAPQLDDHWGALARHLFLAGTRESALGAADCARRAGDVAARRAAFDEAARQYEQALEALARGSAVGPASDTGDLRCKILLSLADVLWPAGQRSLARRRLREAAELARTLGSPTLLGRAAIGSVGRTDLALDVPQDAIALLEEALAAFPTGDDPLRVRMLAGLARARYHGEERPRLVALAREAVAMAERLDDPTSLFSALSSLHYALLVPGTLDERLRVAERLLDLASASGSRHFEATARLWRIVDALEIPDVGLCDRELARFETLAEELRQPFYRWLATAFRGTRAQMEGRLPEADALIHRAVELGEAAGSPNAVVLFGTQLFHLREEQGRVAELEPLIRQVVDSNPALPVFRIGIPLIHALCRRREDARASFDEVAARDFEDVPRDVHRLPMLSSASIVAAYLGDERRARLLLDELLPFAGTVIVAGVATYWGGSIDRMLGLLETTLGQLDDAVRHLSSAIEVATRAAAPLFRAQAEADLARALDRRGGPGDAERARALLDAAAARYRRHGVAWRLEALETATADRAPAKPGVGARTSSSGRFLKIGTRWQIEFDGRTIELPDSKGLQYLSALVRSPGREIHVVDLTGGDGSASGVAPASVEGLTITRTGGADPVLDPRARAEYRARLADLRADLAEAEEFSDAGRTNALQEEIAVIEGELTAAFGLGGRSRRTGDVIERVRKAVYNRVRSAIERIAEQHPGLGTHLTHATRTGIYCVYEPERETDWF